MTARAWSTKVAALAALMLLPLAACGSDDGESASAGGTLNLLSASGDTPNLVLFSKDIATREGFFKNNGLDVAIKQSPSTQAAAALMSGHDHFSMTSFGATATAISQGLPLKIVGSYALEVPGVIVATKEVKTVRDLEGRTIIAAALGNTSHINVTAYAQATGEADPDKLNFVASGNTANSVQYLAAGRGDAAWVQIDSIPKLLQDNPDLHVLVTADQLSAAIGTIGGVIVVTEDYAKSNRDTIVAVMKSIMQAGRALHKDENYFVEHATKIFPKGTFTEDQLHELYPQLRDTFPVNGGMDRALIEKSITAWAKYFDPEAATKGAVKEVSDIVDPSFVRDALKELGGPIDGPGDSADLATQ
jgi:ABC-type nitrate/sulfonate/bicarbonate transport system substrate-binding protein